MYSRHIERHATDRIGWLRASVLGANDGIISTAALILGVAAADSTRTAGLTAGGAGLAGHLQGQRGDDAAAHAGAMHAAEQANQEYREEAAVRHHVKSESRRWRDGAKGRR